MNRKSPKGIGKVKAYALYHGDTFIAAFRFKPKRVRIGGKRGYYAWTDCDGPRYYGEGDHIPNVIEGSTNARCVEITVPSKPKKK